MSVCCWWCCHTFPGPSLHCPFKYDDRTKRFETTGHFCTWECMKAYTVENFGHRAGIIQTYVALMRKHANENKYVPTRYAPKRHTLKMFGGILSIDEFRRGSSNVVVTMPWEKHIMPEFHTGCGTAAPIPKAVSDDSSLVLKRTKPLARAKSTLETTLGITRKTR